MYTVRVKDELIDRIDADYYSPTALKCENKIKSFSSHGVLGEAFEEGYRVVYHGTDSITGLAKNKLIPFLSPTHIDKHGVIDFNSIDWLPSNYKEDYPKGIANSDELLIEVKGNVSKLAIVPLHHPDNLMISGSLFKAIIKKDFDSRYILAYLKSKHGQILKSRLTSNTIINYIAKDALYSIPILFLKFSVQQYIGNKVRQAESLNRWAKKLEIYFESSMKIEFPEAFENKNTGKKYAWAESQDISYTLNTGAFNEESIRVQRYLLSNGGKKIRDIATISTPSTTEYNENTPYIGLDSLLSNSCHISPSTVGSSDITGTSRYLSEGVVISKLRPYLNKVAYIPAFLSGSVGSTELLCLKAKKGFSDWYLYGVLKSEPILKQIKPLATGSTHPRIDQYDVYSIVVPMVTNAIELGEMLCKAQLAYFEAMQLVNTAKSLVEALIEGQLTEAELINAHQAMENGDNSLDKAILANITDKGYGAEGKPLFSDLDALYRLLDEVEADQTEGDL